MHAWSTSTLSLLHSAFMLSVVKLRLKGEVGVCALNSPGNYIVDRGKSWKNHGIVFLNFCGNPDRGSHMSAKVLLNLFNELGKRDKMRGLSSILSIFRNLFNKFNNRRAPMLDSIYL